MNRFWIGCSCSWIVGCSIALNFRPGLRIILSCFVLGLIAAAFAAAWRAKGWQAGVIAGLLPLAIGYSGWIDLHNRSSISETAARLVQTLDENTVTVIGTIGSKVDIDGDHVSFLLKVRELEADQERFDIRPEERVQVSVRLLTQDETSIVAAWRRGDLLRIGGTLLRPEPARNYGGFDYRAYLRMRHIHWQLNAKGTEEADLQTNSSMSPTTRLLRLNDWLRDVLGARIEQLFPGRQSGYMKGLLIGDQNDIEPELYRSFSRLGLTHVLAISGLHVAVFIGILLYLLKRLGLTIEAARMWALALLPAYMLVTGGSPSVLRAGLMGMGVLLLARLKRLGDGLTLTAVSAWGMLLWNPYNLLDVSFQLSFLVTAGLILLVPKVREWAAIRPDWLRDAIVVTVAAQAVSFPLTIYYFNQFSLISLIANLMLVPFISFLVTPAGGLALFVGIPLPTAGAWIAKACEWMNEMTFRAVDMLSGWESPQTIWASPPIWWLALYYAVLLALAGAGWKRRLRRLREADDVWVDEPDGFLAKSAVPLLAAALVLLLAFAYRPDAFSRTGKVEFLDVGQGDSILIRTPGGRHVLIDGGGTLTFGNKGDEWKKRRDPFEVGRKLLVPLLKKRGIHSLDLVIATHEDADHIGGLSAVLDEIPVRRMLFNDTLKENSTAKELFRIAIDKRIPLSPAGSGTEIQLDDQTSLLFLHPVPDPEMLPQMAENQNGRSLVFIMEMEKKRFLMTGDMDAESEREVLARLAADRGQRITGPVDLLKVAHHGSKTSTTDEWLDYWRPASAVISVGAHNLYGHPSDVVIDRLAKRGIPVKRTDLNGEIVVTVMPERYSIRSKLAAEG